MPLAKFEARSKLRVSPCQPMLRAEMSRCGGPADAEGYEMQWELCLYLFRGSSLASIHIPLEDPRP
jgi:hypothetical protein